MSAFCAFLLLSVLNGLPVDSKAELDAAAIASDLAPALVDKDDGDVKADDREGDLALTRYLQASKKNILRGVIMMAHFAGRLPKMQKTATLDAKRHVDRQGVVEYDTTDRQGDVTVQKYLIATYINGEMESSGKDNAKVAVTPDNYKFKYKGRRDKDGRAVFVFEINPRKKREGLFKGEIWLDSDTGLTVREAGRFVKSPSVFLKKVFFAREYTIRDGYAVPKLIQTSIETRFWGQAELDIQYSGFTWEEQQALLN